MLRSLSEGCAFALSKHQAVIACTASAAGFVGSLYLWRIPAGQSRDHPDSIKKRTVSVTLVTIAATVLVVLVATPEKGGRSILAWLGLRREGLLAAVYLPVAATAALFFGPLVQSYIEEDLHPTETLSSLKSDPVAVRNLVVAPVAEEWVFRACMLPLLVPSFGRTKAVLICPLFFGLAHVHHMVEAVRIHNQSWRRAALQSAFQYAYTSVFGLYSAFLFVRTGHVVAPIMSHVFCNAMGFPALEDAIDSPRKKVLGACYVGGAAVFALSITSLTSAKYYPGNPY